MFAALTSAVEGLEVPLERSALHSLFTLHDRLSATLAAAVGGYEAARLHELDGDLSIKTWLVHHTDCDIRSARRWVSLGRLLHACPVLADAAVTGRVGGGQLQVIAAFVPSRHLARFADHEADLVPTLEDLDVADTAVAMAEWRARADAVDDLAPPPEQENQVHLNRTLDGRGELQGSLDPDRTATVEAALRAADPKDFNLTAAQRNAEALETICRHFLDNQNSHTGPRRRPHVHIVIPYDGLADHEGGTYADGGGPVSPTELAVALCDAVLHRVFVHGRSAILDYGRATRTVPVDLANALGIRDQGCRWPGCNRPVSWTDAHHVNEWEHGGPTSIDNLVLLCRRHHRKLHAGRGWRAKLLPDATLEITHPDGRTEATEAPGPLKKRRRRSRAACLSHPAGAATGCGPSSSSDGPSG